MNKTSQGSSQVIFAIPPPGTKPIHAGKHSWKTKVCVNTCGACICTRANTGKLFEELVFEIRIRTFANMYSHLRPLPPYGHSSCITHPWCQHINIFLGSCFRSKYMRRMYLHRENTGKYSWRIIYVLVSCQGVTTSQRVHPEISGLWLERALEKKKNTIHHHRST